MRRFALRAVASLPFCGRFQQRRKTEARRIAANRSARRFRPPWTVEDIGAAFVVIDNAGQKLGYIHYENEPGRTSAAKLLTRDYGGLSASSFSGVTARRFPPPWSVTEPPASKRVSR
jgi:hypothetical protein